MGRPLSWLLTAPLMLIGVVAGHALGYRLTIGHGDHDHVLHEATHTYWAYVPGSIALCVALVVTAAAVRALAAFRGLPRAAAPSWSFALLPPLAFVVQEHLERALGGGAVLATVSEPAFRVGLLVQVPLALAALVVARVLEAAAEGVGRALARPFALSPGRAPLRVVIPQPVRLARIAVAALPYGERGPPPRG